MTILYVETNLLIGLATGREAGLEPLLGLLGPGLRLVVPGVCLFEAMSWMESENRRRREFDQVLGQQVAQLNRDRVSVHARSLRGALLRSQFESRALLRSIDTRLFSAMARLAAAAERIDLDPFVLDRSRDDAVIDELTDNLILHCVLGHAARFPGEDKLFLSGNSRDFGGDAPRQAMRDAGITRYFTQLEDVVGWLRAKAAP